MPHGDNRTHPHRQKINNEMNLTTQEVDKMQYGNNREVIGTASLRQVVSDLLLGVCKMSHGEGCKMARTISVRQVVRKFFTESVKFKMEAERKLC